MKTTDGFTLRVFVIGFTKRRPNQTRKTSYAQTAQVRLEATRAVCKMLICNWIGLHLLQVRQIRKKMVEVITKESNVELNELVNKFMLENIGREIEKVTQGSYQLPTRFAFDQPSFDRTTI